MLGERSGRGGGVAERRPLLEELVNDPVDALGSSLARVEG